MCHSPLPLPSLRCRWLAQVPVLHAVGVGNYPYYRCCCPRVAHRGWAAPPCAGVAPASQSPCRRQPWPRGCPLQPYSGQTPPAAWPRVTAPCSLAAVVAYARRRRLYRHLVGRRPLQPCSRAAAQVGAAAPYWLAASVMGFGAVALRRLATPTMGFRYGWPPLSSLRLL
ncbi:hypothetical protein BHM03_00034052 [Ensete ventricosum]|nr:hypothetical protein BHM03_00034052 [Ensete ventricosum]